MQKKPSKTLYLTQLALFIAIELVMKITGLSAIPVGPLNMTLNMVPIAIGAMLLGPLAGGVLGLVYGCTSLYDAISGRSAMTGVFFQVSPIHTIILCVGMRVLVGVLTGWIFRGVHKIDRTKTISYFVGGLAAPVLNTALFMGYIVLFFYQTEFVQNMVQTLGASGPIMLIVLLVGVQGLVEAATGLVVGGAVAKGVAYALKWDKNPQQPAAQAASKPVQTAPEAEPDIKQNSSPAATEE